MESEGGVLGTDKVRTVALSWMVLGRPSKSSLRERSLDPSSIWGHNFYEPRIGISSDTKSTGLWMLDLQRLELGEINGSCLSCPVCGIQRPEWTEIATGWMFGTFVLIRNSRPLPKQMSALTRGEIPTCPLEQTPWCPCRNIDVLDVMNFKLLQSLSLSVRNRNAICPDTLITTANICTELGRYRRHSKYFKYIFHLILMKPYEVSTILRRRSQNRQVK